MTSSAAARPVIPSTVGHSAIRPDVYTDSDAIGYAARRSLLRNMPIALCKSVAAWQLRRSRPETRLLFHESLPRIPSIARAPESHHKAGQFITDLRRCPCVSPSLELPITRI